MADDPLKTPLFVEKELAGEKATALAVAGERLEASLAALAALDARLRDVGPDTLLRAELERQREPARQLASEQLWFLVVQREAMGLYQHESVYRLYGVPADVRRFAGPRRRG
jgi:hypothetical protein